MKLRIRGNSIRLRLLRGEVAEFAANGVLRETISFGASSLAYVLQMTDAENSLKTEFNGSEIVVSVPIATARNWTETDLISLTGEQRIADDKFLTILVEKDFVCLDRISDKDNKDAYPNTSHKC